MLYREIIAVCSQIHTKHTNTLCGQNLELLNVKLAVHIVTTGFQGVKYRDNFALVFRLLVAVCIPLTFLSVCLSLDPAALLFRHLLS